MNINATLLAQAIVMIVFVAICWRYVYPPILSVMQERERKISDGLEAAKKADDSLEEAQLAFNQELDKAKSEAAELIDKANQRASQIVGDAKNKATDEAEKILTAASKTIENETNKAKEELKSQMSEIIIDTTQKILDQEISSEKHDDLLKKAAAEL
ncbi:F0F1 ATP synthase subunit B [Gammaproteobacteria bacterium]|jgi:F-type H+-transporting ATPase subunit b|nr:F0F1 ATP synthase subunit B [Gammaproteobacteria bacterium]|tara:strand:- start:837 stop:1307 length:471 start_codon:yes stop_codon:yes gene_type:complete